MKDLPDLDVLTGRKGKGGGDSGVKEDPNTLRSASKARIIDLISEGEIGGLLDGDKSIYLNEVPLQNSDDTYNFQGFKWATREGLPDQTSIPGFAEAEATIPVGAEVKQAIPVTRSIDGSTMDAVRVTIQVTGLQHVKQDEQRITGTSVSLIIRWKTNPGGAEISSQTITISGKTNSAYERAYYVEVPGTDTYTLEVERVTADSDTVDLQNGTVWSSYTSINESKFSYPDSAMIALEIDAQQFGSNPPKRAYNVKGRKVKIPDIYNPVTRQYDLYEGPWTGTLVDGFTDNPAWIWYDLATHERYGLGEELGASNVDVWSVYNIGVYCDGLVDDGRGGTEPRFRFNGVIQEQREAWEVLNVLASTFRGMMYWGSGSVTLVQDSPKDPEIEVNQTRVIGGTFRYQKSAKKARHTAVFATWSDPNNFGRPAVEVVEDRLGIATLGYRRKDVVLHGCTSRAMAHRAARWIIYSELNETETVSYVCHADHLNIRPGSVIRVSDPERLGVRNAGRIAGISGSTLTLDKAYAFDTNETYQVSVLDTDGTPELVNLINPGSVTTDTVTMSGSPTRTPLVGEVFAILGTDVSLPQFRVLSIREVEINEVKCYEVTALRYDPNKFASVEDNIDFPIETYTKLPQVNKVEPPASITVSRQIEVVNPQSIEDYIDVGWALSPDRYIDKYAVVYKRDGDPQWVEHGYTTGNSAQIHFPYPDTYTIRVYAKNVFGYISADPVEATIEIDSASPVPAPSVSGLELFEKGIVTEFEGKDAVFAWRRASGLAQSPGAERFGGDSSSTDPLFQHYQVEVYNGSTLLRREFVTDNFYTYTYENNFDDNNGVPLRSFSVEVAYVNKYNEVGQKDTITVTNTKPSMPVVTVTASYREIFLDYVEPTDPDFEGMVVWADTSPSVTTTDDNIVFKGRGKASFPASANTTYYYKYAVFDEFGTDGLVASSEASITTLEPINDIPDGSITLTKLASSVQDEINRVMEIGKSVIPPGISAGVNGDVYFHPNELTTGADVGEIRVSNAADDGGDGWFNHPTLNRIDETGTNGQIFHTPFNINTPWEGSTVPRGQRFYIMYSNSDWSSRMGGGLTDPATGNAYVGVVTYDDVNDIWYAHDDTNSAGVQFTPANTDVLLAVGTKESTTGGIDSIRSLVGTNAPIEQRVSNTEILVGEQDDTADAGGSAYARIAQEILGRQSGDTALGYRLDSVEAGAVLPNLTDVHPDLVWQWNDGTGSGDATAKALVTTSVANNGIEITATADTGLSYAGWDLSSDQQNSVDWEKVRYAVVVMEFVSGASDIPVTPYFNWRSGTNSGGSWILALNNNAQGVYTAGKMYTFVFDLEGSADSGPASWGTADPTRWWVAPAALDGQTTNDKWRVHKVAFVAYGDLSYIEQKARADIFQEALFDDGTSTAAIILQTQAGTGDSNTVARAFLTSRAGGDGAAMSEIGFEADYFSIWNPTSASNLPVFQVSGNKIRMNASNVEIDGNLLVAGTVGASALNVGLNNNIARNADFSANFSYFKTGTNSNVTKTVEACGEAGSAFGSEQVLVLTSSAVDQTDNVGPSDASGTNRHDYDVVAGEKWEVSVYAQATNAGNAQLVVQFFSAYSGGYLGAEDISYNNTTASTDGTLANMDRLGAVITVPATAVRMRVLMNGSSLESTEVAKFRRLQVSKAFINQTALSDWVPSGGTLIDGQGIVADSITGDKIFAESQIQVGTDSVNRVGLSGNPNYDWRIWSGAALGAGAPFSVDKYGHVTMRSFDIIDGLGNLILTSSGVTEYLRGEIFAGQGYTSKRITARLTNNDDFYTIDLSDTLDDVRVAGRHFINDHHYEDTDVPTSFTIEVWHATSDPTGQNDAWWTANATKLSDRAYGVVTSGTPTINQVRLTVLTGEVLFGAPALSFYSVDNVGKSDHSDPSVPSTDTYSKYLYDEAATATFAAGTHYFRIKVYDNEGHIESVPADELGREVELTATGSGSFRLEDTGDTTGSSGVADTFVYLNDTPTGYDGSRRNVPMVDDISSPTRMFFRSLSEVSQSLNALDFDIRPGNSATDNVSNFNALTARLRDSGDVLYAKRGGAAEIYFPPGTYSFDGQLRMPESVFLRGAGQNSTTFYFSGTVTDAAILLSPQLSNGYNTGGIFRDFSLAAGGVWDEAIKVAWPDDQTPFIVRSVAGNWTQNDTIYMSPDGTWANRTWTANFVSHDLINGWFYFSNENPDPQTTGTSTYPLDGDAFYNNNDTGTATYSDRLVAFTNESRVYIKHVNVYGSGIGNYFKKGIYLRNVSYYDVNSIRYIGTNADATYGSPAYYDGVAVQVETQTTADTVTNGQSLEGVIEHVTASDCDTGISIIGYPEGQYIAHSNFVRVRTGINAQADIGTTQPSLVLHQNHINAAGCALHINGYSQWYLTNNSFSYWNDATVEASFNSQPFYAVDIQNATSPALSEEGIITGNTFVTESLPAGKTGDVIHLRVDADQALIDNNQFIGDADGNNTVNIAISIIGGSNSYVGHGNRFSNNIDVNVSDTSGNAQDIAYWRHTVYGKNTSVGGELELKPKTDGSYSFFLTQLGADGALFLRDNEGNIRQSVFRQGQVEFKDTNGTNRLVIGDGGAIQMWDQSGHQALSINDDHILLNSDHEIRFNTTDARVGTSGSFGVLKHGSTEQIAWSSTNVSLRYTGVEKLYTSSAGGTLVGTWDIGGSPLAVQSDLATYLPLAGGIMSGNLDLNGNDIIIDAAGGAKIDSPGTNIIDFTNANGAQMSIRANGFRLLYSGTHVANTEAWGLGIKQVGAWSGAHLTMEDNSTGDWMLWAPSTATQLVLGHTPDGFASRNYNIRMDANAATALYYANAEKFTTDASGVSVTGRLTIAGTSTQLYNDGNDNLQLGASTFIQGTGSAGNLIYGGFTALSFNGSGGTLTGAWNVTSSLTVGGTAVSLAGHSHVISDVTGLQTALDGKSDTGHTHSYLPLSGGAMTGNIELDGTRLDLDADNDTYIYSSADDVINIYAGAVENMIINANVVRARYAGVDRLVTAIDGTTVNSIATYGARVILENTNGDRVWGLTSPSGSDQFVLQDITNAKYYLAANRNAGLLAYYDGAARLETTSAGGTLTGTWNATTALQVGGAAVATESYVTSTINKAYVDALNVDADTLDNQDGSYYLAWANLTGVPSTFTPSAHTHAISDVTGLQTALDGKSATGHTHSDYVAVAGDTMTGVLVTPTVDLTSTSSLQYNGVNRIKFGANLTQFVNSSIYAARIAGAGAQIQLQGPSGAYVAYLNHAVNGQVAIQSYDGAAIETMANFYQGGGVDLFYDTNIRLSATSAGGTLTGTWNATTDLQIGGASVATQTWVSSQGYLTSVPDNYVLNTGDTMTGALEIDGDVRLEDDHYVRIGGASSEGHMRMQYATVDDRFWMAPYDNAGYQWGHEFTYMGAGAGAGYWKFDDRLDVGGAFNAIGGGTFSSTLNMQNASIIFNTGGVIQAQSGAAASPTYTFAAQTNMGMYRSGTDALAWAIGGAERMSLTASGLDLNGIDLIVTAAGTGYIHEGATDRIDLAITGSNRMRWGASTVDVVNVPLFMGKQNGWGGEVQLQAATGSKTIYLRQSTIDGQFAITAWDGAEEDTLATFSQGAGAQLMWADTEHLSTSAAGGTLTGTWNATTALQVGGATVATQTWVSGQGFVTGGPYLPLTGGTLTGDVTAPRLRLTATDDVTISSTLHAFQIGADSGLNLVIDGNEIMARNNGAASTLNLNVEGGEVQANGYRVLTVNDEGTGNGLDADTLDGIEGANYARTDINETFVGSVGIENGSWLLTDYSSGFTAITGLVPGSTFGAYVRAPSSGHFVIGLRNNDLEDSFAIVSSAGNTANEAYDFLAFRVRADGNVIVGHDLQFQDADGQILDSSGSARMNFKNASYNISWADNGSHYFGTNAGGSNDIQLYSNTAAPGNLIRLSDEDSDTYWMHTALNTHGFYAGGNLNLEINSAQVIAKNGGNEIFRTISTGLQLAATASYGGAVRFKPHSGASGTFGFDIYNNANADQLIFLNVDNSKINALFESTGEAQFYGGSATPIVTINTGGMDVEGRVSHNGLHWKPDSVNTSNNRFMVLRDVAPFSSDVATPTGTIIFKTGIQDDANTFFSGKIIISRNYYPDIEVFVNGYQQSAGTVHSPNVTCSDTNFVHTVRFATKDGVLHILIGDTSSAWTNYISARIEYLRCGYTGAADEASDVQDPDAYSCTVEGTETGYTVRATIYPRDPHMEENMWHKSAASVGRHYYGAASDTYYATGSGTGLHRFRATDANNDTIVIKPDTKQLYLDYYGDSNSYIQSQGADIIGIVTAGVTHFQVTSVGVSTLGDTTSRFSLNTGGQGYDFYYDEGTRQGNSRVSWQDIWYGKNSTNNWMAYGQFQMYVSDATAGSEHSLFRWYAYDEGTNQEVLRAGPDGLYSWTNHGYIRMVALDTASAYFETDRAEFIFNAPIRTTATYLGVTTSDSRSKLRLYGSSAVYGIGMESAVTYGDLNDYAMTFQMNTEADRGFWWGNESHTKAQGAMALTTDGKLTVDNKITVPNLDVTGLLQLEDNVWHKSLDGVSRFYLGTSNATYIGTAANNPVYLTDNGGEYMTFYPSLNRFIPKNSDSDTYIHHAADNTLGMVTGGVTSAFFSTSGIVAKALSTTGGALTIEGESTDLDWNITQNTAQLSVGSSSYAHVIMTEAGGTNLYHAGVQVVATNGSGWNVLKGLKVGSPTGSWKGDGTINAVAVYDDNVLLSCYVFQQANYDHINLDYWDSMVPDRENEIRRHDSARKFGERIGTEYDPLTLDGYSKHWKEKGHLTSMPNEEKFDIEKGMSTGTWTQRLIETVEIQAVLIEKLNEKDKTQQAEIDDLKAQIELIKKAVGLD